MINATNGKISFWDNIENTDALNLFEKRRNAAEGSCGGMLSGEIVTDVEDANPAGFVVTFSSGRTAQVLVRDAQSRPAVSVNILRPRNSGTGLLSGLKSVFGGGGFLKTIAATRSRPLKLREHAQIIVGNEDAVFQYWQLDWSGPPNMHREIDALSAIETALLPTTVPEARSQNVKLIDFVVASDSPNDSDLLLLVSYIDLGVFTYALVELDIDTIGATARRAIVLHSYTDPVVELGSWKPRICLPNPGHTALVVFENAITLVTMTTPDATPDTQMMIDAGQYPEPFQDTIPFRIGKGYIACGVSDESNDNRHHTSSAIVFIKGFGLLRIINEEPSGFLPANKRREISVKSKIEQAVFFGSMSSNPLNLTRKSNQQFDAEEVEQAALQISREIITTESPFISQKSASMADHLEKRAQNLADLATYVFSLTNEISRATRWLLRFDGEKLAACRKVWDLYDELLNARGSRETRILAEALQAMASREKTRLYAELGDKDVVRFWCTRDVGRMEYLFTWVLASVDFLVKEKVIHDPDKYIALVMEANAIVLEGLTAAYAFRMVNERFYGLEISGVKAGVQTLDYHGLPEFWTSDKRMLDQIRDQFRRVKLVVVSARDASSASAEDLATNVRVLIEDGPGLVDAFCRGNEELTRWNWTLGGDEAQQNAADLQDQYDAKRTPLITDLLELGKTARDEAMDIGETYRDMDALVDIMETKLDLLRDLKAKEHRGSKEMREVETLELEILNQSTNYFKLFGDDWGEATFSKATPSRVLNQAASFNKEVTRFLKAEPQRAKLDWINDIISHQDYASAATSLTNVAQEENGLWNKKVELSIAKLALVSIDAGGDGCSAAVKARDEKQLVKIQERLFEHIQPELYNAVDASAELELAMQTFGASVYRRKSLSELMMLGLERLILHRALDAEQLIDVLTLMDQVPCSLKEYNLSGRETYLALVVLKNSGLAADKTRFELALKVIWQRCYLKDDWEQVNSTGSKSDADAAADLQSTTLFRTIYEGHARGMTLSPNAESRLLTFNPGLFDEPHGLRMLTPSQCIDAETTADHLQARFPDLQQCQQVAGDIRQDDQILGRDIEQVKLDHWVTATRELVDRRIQEQELGKQSMAAKIGEMLEAVNAVEPDLQPESESNTNGTWAETVQRALGMA